MTTEPKFIPREAATIQLDEDVSADVNRELPKQESVAAVRDPQSHVSRKKTHHLTWLSIVGGASSAGALGLLRRFLIKS